MQWCGSTEVVDVGIVLQSELYPGLKREIRQGRRAAMGWVGRPYWGAALRPSLSTAFSVGKGCQAGDHRSRGSHPSGHKNSSCRVKAAAGLLSTSENPRLQWFRRQEFIALPSTKFREGSPDILSPSRSQRVIPHLPAPSRYRPPSSRSPLRV